MKGKRIMKKINFVLLQTVKFFLLLTLICGLIYSLTVTGIAKVVFKELANGSIIEVDGKNYGSRLLAQQFTGDTYLWGRIMNIDVETFTDDEGNKLMYAVPSNLSPASQEYEALIAERVAQIRKAHPEKGDEAIPVDLVTGSGSGLDPHISVAAADYQVSRIAKNRGISEENVKKIIDQYTTHKFLGILGEDVVNVLEVNLALDGILK